MRYAVRNILRLKTRSMLTFAIAFSILFLAMFGILIFRLCEDNRSRFYGPLDGSVHVTNQELEPYLTYEAAEAFYQDAEVITGISAVKEYVGILSEIPYVGYGSFTRNRYSGESVPAGEQAKYIKGYQIVGVTSMEILEEVYAGDLTITEGTMITETDHEKNHNKIVISKELADQNGLSLGDTVTLDMVSLYAAERDMIGFEKSREEDAYVYIVGGIYQHRVDNFAGVSEPWLLNANHVYVPLSTLVEIAGSERIEGMYHSGISSISDLFEENPCVVPDSLYFRLSKGTDVETLCREINEVGFTEPIRLTEYVSDSASSPSARLSEIISIVLVGIVGVGFAVFMLSVLFHMKARHRELAVLVALGKKRSAVTASFFTEVLILVFFAFLFSAGILTAVVSLCAVPITKYLYSAELSAQFRNESADFFLFEVSPNDFVTENLEQFGFLFREYVIPALIFAMIAGLLIVAALYLFVGEYVRRINALSGVGGKE